MSEKSRRRQTYVLSFFTALLCMGMVIVSVNMGKDRDEGFALGDFSGVSVEDMEDAFEESGTNEDLAELLKVLCYKAAVEKDDSAEPLIASYGTLLLDRARNKEVDLASLGDDEKTLELLRLIRSYGAK